LKILLPFLSDQKDWKATMPLSPPLFSQNHPIKIFRKPFSQNSLINMQILFYLFMYSEPKSKPALIQKRSEIK